MTLRHAIAFCSAFVLATQFAVAHPFHVSTTEVEYNAATDRFEVAMRLRIADLEDAVSAIQNSRFRIVEGAHLQAPVMSYLQKRFSILRPAHDRCELSWVGFELELHDVWIYFEAESLTQHTLSANHPKPEDNTPSRKVHTWDELFAPNTSEPVAAPKPLSIPSLTVRNTALMEIQPQQVNMIAVKVRDRSQTAAHTLEKPQHELLFVDHQPR